MIRQQPRHGSSMSANSLYKSMSAGGGSGKGAGAAAAKGWEELRREARKLEGELDQRLAAFNSSTSASGTASLEQRCAQIEQLLQELSDVNEQMDRAVQHSHGRGSNDVMMHTLARHRDILQEFMQEFRRKRNAVVSASEHAKLLAGARAQEEGRAGDFGAGGQSEAEKQQLLLRERGGISAATSQVDDLVGQAQAQMQALAGQRSLFGDIGSKVGTLGARFPFMNSIISSIHRKKNKDNLILAAVVSVCTLFLLAYWVSKR